MSIHDRKLRSLTVSRVYREAPKIASPKSSISKVFAQFKEAVRISNGAKEEYLLVLTCDHIAILRSSTDADSMGGSSHRHSSAKLHPHTSKLEGAFSSSSSLSEAMGDTGAMQSLVLSVALSHLTHVASHGNEIELECVSSAGPRAVSSDPFAPVPAFPVLASLSERAATLVGDTSTPHKSKMAKQASMLGAILPLQHFSLWTDTEEDASELAAAINSAMQRLIDALLWLDRGLPLNQSLSVCVASLDNTFHAMPEGWSAGQQIVARRPVWGTWLNLPPLPLPSKNPADFLDPPGFYLDLATPLGACHVCIPVSNIILAVNKEAGHFMARARPHVGDSLVDNPHHQDFSVDVSCVAECIWSSTASTAAAASTGTAQQRMRDQRNTGSQVPRPLGLGKVAVMAACALCLLAVLFPLLGPFVPVVTVILLVGGAYASGLLSTSSRSVPAAGNGLEPSSLAALSSSVRGSSGNNSYVATIRVKLIRGELVEEAAPSDDAAEDEGPLIPSSQENLQPVGTHQQQQQQLLPTLSLQVSQSIRRMPSMYRQSTAPSVVDIGAVSFRRVVSVTTATLEVSPSSGELTTVAETVEDGEIGNTEAAALRMLAARSPAVTPDLYQRYVAACSGDRDLAMQRLRTTVEWRVAHNIDAVLSSPIPAFFDIKAAYVHAVIGRTRDGLPVIVEGMGGFRATMAELRSKSIIPRQLLHQFVFVMEWVTQKYDPSPYPGGKFVRIYDFKGIGFSDVSDSEAVGLGKQMMDMLENYYPERMAKAFVVNTPGFFGVLWKMVRPMLDPRTAEKITLTSSKKATLTALRTVMDDDVIPKAYGGSGVVDWYDGPEEKEIAELAKKVNARTTAQDEVVVA